MNSRIAQYYWAVFEIERFTDSQVLLTRVKLKTYRETLSDIEPTDEKTRFIVLFALRF